MLSKINIKQFSRVAKIHLVNIVIDGFPGTRRQNAESRTDNW